MSDPSYKDIEEFGVFTGTEHQPEIAVDYLNHNSHDVAKAVDDWFNKNQDPNFYKNQQANWAMVPHGPANQMQAMPPAEDNWDWAPNSIHPLGSEPMSRPPSRNTQANKEHIAWSGQPIGPVGIEDREMQEAIELSRRDLGATTSIGPSIFPSTPSSTGSDDLYKMQSLPSFTDQVPYESLPDEISVTAGRWSRSVPDQSNFEKVPPRGRSPRRRKASPTRSSRSNTRLSNPGHLAGRKVTFLLPEESLTDQSAVKVMDPEPKDRARGINGEPAFLKPLPNGDLLPSLISILHSIPRCRKELLSKDDFLPQYKSNQHWWEGDSIESTRVTADVGEGGQAEPLTEVIYETQRLMAFLDRTNRSYGSVESLTRLMPVQQNIGSDSELVRFLRGWDEVAMSDASNTDHDLGPWSYMFTSKIIAPPDTPDLTIFNEIQRRINITSECMGESPEVNLYDCLDKAILGDPKEERSFTHEQFAPVFVVNMELDQRTRNVQIPQELYLDRYLEQNAEFVRSSRTLIQEEETKVDELTDKIARIETFRFLTTGRQGDASQLMSIAKNYLTQRSNNPSSFPSTGNGQHPESMFDEHTTKAQQVLEQLEGVSSALKERLRVFNEEKQLCEEKIKTYSRCGTSPDDAQFPGTIKYRFRGLATGGNHKPTITYAIYPVRKFGANGLLGSREEPQWWKMVYDTRYTAFVKKVKVSEEQVLEAAREVEQRSLLVYVHEDYDQGTQDLALPPQLKEFVERDNDFFRAELNDNGDAVEVLEGIPVDIGRPWTTGSDNSSDERGPTLEIEHGVTKDPTMMDANNEGVPEKVQEMEELGREETYSPKRRKVSPVDVDSDMETMAPASDTEMG